jgi:hypothetical protein
MGILLIFFCILITLSGFTRLIIGIVNGEKSPAAESVIAVILAKIFAFAGLPCLMLGAALVTVEFFVNGEGISKLVIVALCTAFSAFVSFAMNIRQCMPYRSGRREGLAEHKAAFEFIGVWNEAITANAAEHGSFGRLAVEAAARLNAVCDQIDDYMAFQKKHCLSLLEKRADCEQVFARLAETAEKCAASFSGFQKRLNAANASLLYFYESGSIENEMRASLVNELRLRTNELDGQIQKILSRLEMTEFKAARFADFAKPYRQTIGIYSTRLETTLDHIDKKSKVSGDLAEITALALDAARAFKNGIDTFRRDTEAKIQAAWKEAAQRVLEAEARVNTAEVKMRSAEAEAAAAREQAKALSLAVPQAQAAGTANEEYQDLRRKHRAFFAIGLTAIIVSVGVGISKYKDMEIRYNSKSLEYSELETLYSVLETDHGEILDDYERLKNLEEQYNLRFSEHSALTVRYNNLLNDYNKSKSIWGINATSLKAGNSDRNNNWITRPGERLNARDIRYLSPFLTVDSMVSGNRTFYVKIIRPNGTIYRNPSVSPEGYSYSWTRSLSAGKNQTVDLGGWGDANQSNYAAGTYTIEVWYDGVQLITGKVTLY